MQHVNCFTPKPNFRPLCAIPEIFWRRWPWDGKVVEGSSKSIKLFRPLFGYRTWCLHWLSVKWHCPKKLPKKLPKNCVQNCPQNCPQNCRETAHKTAHKLPAKLPTKLPAKLPAKKTCKSAHKTACKPARKSANVTAHKAVHKIFLWNWTCLGSLGGEFGPLWLTTIMRWVCWTFKSDWSRTTKCDPNHISDMDKCGQT